MQLGDLFDLSLVRRREDVGLEFCSASGAIEAYTFGEIDRRANRMARALEARGVGRSDRVCVHLGNCVEFLDLFLACTRLGAIFVPVNVLYREREVAHILGDANPTLTVTAEPAILPQGVASTTVDALTSLAAGQQDGRVRARIESDHPAAIIYTSGTTGRSKGAVLSHLNLAANAINLIGEWRISSSDRYLAVLPLFHVHGLANGVCSWLISGCRMRLAARFEHQRALEWFEAFHPTLFFGVPTVYIRLLDFPADAARRAGEHARLFVSGSAPLPAHVFEAFRSRFGHAILERYGMTEALMIASNPYEGERRPGTVGVPLAGVSVHIDGAEADEGEVWVRGPTVCASYWNDESGTAAAFTDGWFRTGDIGARSSDGYLTLRGRTTDLIISGGFNVYPRELEEWLLEQPGVREAAVAGAPDDLKGEVVVAYVVTDAPLDEDALRVACARSFASFKIPRSFIRIDALPRNALGKVQKHLLTPPERT